MDVRRVPCLVAMLAATTMCTISLGQVPADVAEGNRAIGKTNNQAATAVMYRPLAQYPPYPEAAITRDVSYGADPKNLLDIFVPSVREDANLPVMVFVSGGPGIRKAPGSESEPFFDNILLWAAKNRVVGVNTERRGGQDLPWDAGVRDVATIVRWVQANIGRFGGDPNNVFFMGHGLGATLITTYLAHPEFWGGQSPGLKGALLLSAPLNLAPLLDAGRAGNPLFEPSRSVLAGLKASTVPLFIGLPEYVDDRTTAAGNTLYQELCSKTCPGYTVFKDHQHQSLSYSFNSGDETVSGAVLNWIRSVVEKTE